MSVVNIDHLVQVYAKMRDARAGILRRAEQEAAAIEADMAKIKAVLLNTLNATNSKSVATDHGTVYRTQKIKPSAADWSAIWDWMVKNDGFDLMERRLKSEFVKRYMEEHNDTPPPGVNVHRAYEVSIRRPTTTPNSNAKD